MDQDEELGGSFLISVEDLGLTGLWPSIREVFESLLPLRDVRLVNKFGISTVVDQLPLQCVPSNDKRLLRLKAQAQSCLNWFRNPYVHVILVSTADVTYYKSTLKMAIRGALADIEREWGPRGGEAMLVYVRPYELDQSDKSAKKVFERIWDDYATRLKGRVVRLDVSSSPSFRGGRAIMGTKELLELLVGCLILSFETRQTGYVEEVRRLTSEHSTPSWSFAKFYLVKDSFALMLDGLGLLNDALREYLDVEAAYENQELRGCAGEVDDFGLAGEGVETASLFDGSRWTMRRIVLDRVAVPEFKFRQYLFAVQIRLLLQQGRTVDAAERGLYLIRKILKRLREREVQGLLPPLFKETWSFSASTSLTLTLTSCLARATRPGEGLLPAPPPPAAVAAYFDTAPNSNTRERTARKILSSPPPPNSATTLPSPELISWALAVPGDEPQLPDLDVSGLGGAALLPASLALMRSDRAARERECVEHRFYSALGQLYELARQQVQRAASAVGVTTASKGGGEALALRRFGSLTQCPSTYLKEILLEMSVNQSPSQSEILNSINISPSPSLGETAAGPASSSPWAGERGMQSLPAKGSWLQRCARLRVSLPPSPSEDTRSSTHTYELHGSPTLPTVFNDNAHHARNVSVSLSDEHSSPGPPGPRNISTPRRPGTPTLSINVQPNSSLHRSSVPLTSSPAQPVESSHVPVSEQWLRLQTNERGVVYWEEAAKVDGTGKKKTLSHEDINIKLPGFAAASRDEEVHTSGPSLSRSRSLTEMTPASCQAPQPSASPVHVAHVCDWRLRLVLNSSRHLSDLLTELALRGAWSLLRGGRPRAAALVWGDVASAAQAGDAATAELEEDLREYMVQLLSTEGWWLLQGVCQQRLLSLHTLTSHVMSPITALRLLELPFRAVEPEARRAALDVLATASGVQLHTSAAIMVSALGDSTSKFWGSEGDDGQPLLSPVPHAHQPAISAAGHKPRGARTAVVGDVVDLDVMVWSGLPAAVHLDAPVLVLGVMTRSIESWGSVPHVSSNSSLTGSGISTLRSRQPSQPLVELPSEPLSPQRKPQLWQETEELEVTQLVGAWVNSGAAVHLMPHNASSAKQPSPARNRADPSSSGASRTAGDGWRPVLLPPSGGLLLQPGLTRLTFRAAPLRPGVCFLRQLRVRLGACELRVGAVEGTTLAETEAGGMGCQPQPQTSKTELGVVGSDGKVGSISALLVVAPPARRVDVVGVMSGAGVTAGASTWVGIALAPTTPAEPASPLLNVVLRDTSHAALLPHSPLVAPLPDHTRGEGSFITTHVAIMRLRNQQRDLETKAAGNGSADKSKADLDLDVDDSHILWRPMIRGMVDLGLNESVDGSGGADVQRSLLPCVVWIPIRAYLPDTEPDILQVSPNGSWGDVRSQGRQNTAGATVGPLQSADVGNATAAGLVRESCQPSLELEVGFEYVVGCRRSQTRIIALPLVHPLHVEVHGVEVANGSVLLAAFIKLKGDAPVVLHSVTLSPQCGLAVAGPVGGNGGAVMPIELWPGARLNLAFLMQRAPAVLSSSQFDSTDHSILNISYAPCHHRTLTPLPNPAPAHLRVVGTRDLSLWPEGSIPPPPAYPPSTAPAHHHDSHPSTPLRRKHHSMTGTPTAAHGAVRSASFFHAADSVQLPYKFVLTFHPGSVLAQPQVRTRLLGPTTAHLGEAVTLMWQLSLTPAPHSSLGSFSGAADDLVYYEVCESRGKGSSRGTCGTSTSAPRLGAWAGLEEGMRGAVRLGPRDGGVAVVEVVVVPKTAGLISAPLLAVRGAVEGSMGMTNETAMITVLP